MKPAKAEKTVLVIDDDSFLRAAVATVLSSEGYEVVGVPNGLEALHVLRQGLKPTVIVLDISMPVIDGNAFAEAHEKSADLARIPLIVISGQDKRPESGPLSKHSFLEKPFSPDSLLDVVERSISAAASIWGVSKKAGLA